ncbi:MAG TPA: RHS repeat-associated core domain-containing protein, partial [Mycobacterium sp.]|nr:RHS repeat-associated core domain-containing protein [Mycobacterium sp.]
SYAYDTLSELTSQTDAKGQTSTLAYDKLGRITGRVEPDMTCVWVYDSAANGIGKLASASITAGPGAGYRRSYAYDVLSRPVQAATTIAGTVYTLAASYDANGRIGTVAYPSGFGTSYAYTALGYARQIADSVTGKVYWTANAEDAELHLTQQTAGNGVATNEGFDALTGRLLNIQAGTGSSVANFSYTYDKLGELLSRADANESLTESFVYDGLDRLTSSTVSLSPTPLTKTFSYSAIGNLLSKSDVGTYSYPPAGGPLPHAVTSISGGTISTTFTYDANGNQTSGLGRSIAWTSYNTPASITQGSRTISFGDGPDHQRFQQVSPEGTTLYFDGFGVHVELFTPASGAPQWNEYLMVGGGMIGVRFNTVSAGSVATRYFHTDHLGSIAVITDENGVVVERSSYDAWGKRRFANGTDDPTGSIVSETTRGFTGQEQLGDVGLVHLNGRVYDPLVGRMMSADPHVTLPGNGQSWNRYSYVINNPLAFTDPTGFDLFDDIAGAFSSAVSAVGSFFTDAGHAIGTFLNRVPIVGTVLEIAATAACGPAAALCAFASTAFVAGVTTGNLGYALKSGLVAAATTAGFQAVSLGASSVAGSLVDNGISAQVAGAAAQAVTTAGNSLVGCVSAIASGASCGPAALAAGIGSLAGPATDSPNFALSLATRAVLGGLASVAGGGKFANGAETAAFAYAAGQVEQGAGTATEVSQQQADDRSDSALAMAPADPVSGKICLGPMDCPQIMTEFGGGGGVPRGDLDIGAAARSVISETLAGVGNFTSRFVLSAEETLNGALDFLGSGYREVASGVFRSSDGLRQFRMDNGSLTGAHGDIGPHVHFETYGPGANKPASNNHVPLDEP